MLQNLIIFSLSIVAIQATGEFTVLSAPSSLLFKGNEAIQSHEIGDVLYASLGNAVIGDCHWSGLYIVDPFNLPKKAFVISINGIARSNISSTGKTYTVQGNTVEQSLNDAMTQLEANKDTVCAVSFDPFEEGKQSFRNIFGDVNIPPIVETKHPNRNLRISDKQVFESLAYLDAIADNLSNMKKSCNLMYIGLSFDKHSEVFNEAMDLASKVIKKFNTAAQKSSNNEALVVTVVNKADGNSRNKRDVAPNDAKTQFNLAEYYNEDYPVIFNIILWFMVVFGFALLAICYAIGSMDPGRDSIIYRMTSTRMKKDN